MQLTDLRRLEVAKLDNACAWFVALSLSFTDYTRYHWQIAGV
jgi:hypothetical protein